MQEYKAKISENGRVLIPAVIRHQLHLEPGEELILRIKDDELHLISIKSALKKAQALVKGYIPRDQSLVEALKVARKTEVADEQKRT